ncbi:MAG: glycosyltransferase family 1 protein [Gemmatimonadetes bacterium]|nr:glycosyltransferase family 1 protein [Gemmatimonadota bacterium]
MSSGPGQPRGRHCPAQSLLISLAGRMREPCRHSPPSMLAGLCPRTAEPGFPMVNVASNPAASNGARSASTSGDLSVVDVTSFFSETASGGVRTYLTAKARAYDRPGIRHTIVVPGEKTGFEEWEGGTLARIGSPVFPLAPAYRQLVDWRALRDVFEIVNPSVIEVGGPFSEPILVRLALSGRRVPVVGFYHADLVRTFAEPFVDHAVLSPLRAILRMGARRMIRAVYNRFDATVCASSSMFRELRALGVKNVHEVPLGVDLETFRPLDREDESDTRPLPARNGAPIAVYVGRICPEKRLDVLLDGHAMLPREEQPNLFLVGDGNIRDSMAARARDGGRVTLLPYVSDREELVRVYNAADYYVAPGPGETFGLSIGEAMACGLPVLCVGRGAGPDRVEGSGASELYRHGDPADVARGIRAMRRHLGQDARERARAHAERTLDWAVTFDRLLALYDQLASAGGTS